MVQTRRQAKEEIEATVDRNKKVDGKPKTRNGGKKGSNAKQHVSIEKAGDEDTKIDASLPKPAEKKSVDENQTNANVDVGKCHEGQMDETGVFAQAASRAVRKFLQIQDQSNATTKNGPQGRRYGTKGTNKTRNDVPGWKPDVKLPKPLTEKEAFHADWEQRERHAKQEQRQHGEPKQATQKWYSIPTKEITPEVKMDLKILKLRNALDPKRFYKTNDESKLPERFEFGTVVEPAAEFYSSRLTKANRKRTITEELLSDRDATRYTRKKFLKMQEERMQWGGRTKGKGAYKKKNIKHKKHGKY
uniref:Fcf2 pre-rRNA processing C-terminal domain-containing protein n=1 Tax=Picocystis salinarum TaxID=88271 RepID=A0A7S3UFG7_9CHLO|mmetsp:Transcript_6402/g.39966  ORF Transcript_6402/g.39966 Transcript_6402/m.39966 type:complete len:303 (-) Transcript_6402:5166-6074(-)|eukprot:CAMPEP_0183832868 /NCGR_PEP_ID=MMETSP0807_2-20130328/5712_1 /TAXON_ID=88271 /ORGANISM="Picocystis salinarum, Strain CCMP1897" /LENGTH=302 /DNA_ID=CAMNT_0026078685 /DNA_START=104 /DNA_END=1012 /DNA_ORIENTATION=-